MVQVSWEGIDLSASFDKDFKLHRPKSHALLCVGLPTGITHLSVRASLMKITKEVGLKPFARATTRLVFALAICVNARKCDHVVIPVTLRMACSTGLIF